MKTMRAVPYMAENVTSLMSLLDMMRYDGMRFCPAANLAAILVLERRRDGVINKDDPVGVKIALVKDQTKDWQPTQARWHSFGMKLRQRLEFSQAQRIN